MITKPHIILGILFVLILALTNLFTPLQLLLILAASILIDADHWLFYVVYKRDFSISSVKKAYDFCYRLRKIRSSKRPLCVFHTIEFYLLLALLTFLFPYPFFLYIFIGVLFHLLIDLIDMAFIEKRCSKRISLIYTLIKK